jgi:hypothetical protein
MPVPSQGHYGFHSFPVFDWFCLFIYLWVLTFPLEDYSEFGNFVITLIYKYTYYAHIISQKVCNNNKRRTMKNNYWMYYYYFPCTSGNVRIGDCRLIGMRKSNLNANLFNIWCMNNWKLHSFLTMNFIGFILLLVSENLLIQA